MGFRSTVAALCLIVIPAPAARAQAVVIEAFKSDSHDTADFQPTGAAFEYQGRPVWRLGSVELGFGLRVAADDGESLWIGGGAYAEAPLGGAWVAEGTLMPGYYDPGSSAFDLGSDLEFHSSIGVGYGITDTSRLSFALTHLSNAGTAERNPGRNGIALRLRHSF